MHHAVVLKLTAKYALKTDIIMHADRSGPPRTYGSKPTNMKMGFHIKQKRLKLMPPPMIQNGGCPEIIAKGNLDFQPDLRFAILRGNARTESSHGTALHFLCAPGRLVGPTGIQI